jgi:hypothetical protein
LTEPQTIQAKDGPLSTIDALRAGVGNIVDRWRYFVLRRGADPLPRAVSIPQHAIPDLRVHGYAVIPNYYGREKCEGLRVEIDRIMAEQPDAIQNDKFNADQRMFGSERASAEIAAFNQDPFPIAIGEAYRCGLLTAFSTLAGRISAQPGNMGSGQGWHRDAFHFQFKSMIYLTDVDVNNGPFQLLQGSHRAGCVFFDTLRARLPRAPYSRLTDEQVEKLVAAAKGRLKTFVAPAGTLILFDSSTIHRGAPVKSGIRYALTNYYYEPAHVTKALEGSFAPFARPSLGQK